MKKIVTIKIGGVFSADEKNLLKLASEMDTLKEEYDFLIIHGGGAEVTALSRRFGIEPVFKEGIRVTTGEEMVFVDKVLSGKINKRLVRLFQKAGFNAVGLTGSDGRLFTGKSIGQENDQHTGKIEKVDSRLAELLIQGGFLPVIGSTSMDEKGMPLNINADDVAFMLSAGMKVWGTVFLSDIPGILKDGKVINTITPEEINKEIQNGVITGGMIPKVNSSLGALNKGVQRIIIGEYKDDKALTGLIRGDLGTHITR